MCATCLGLRHLGLWGSNPLTSPRRCPGWLGPLLPRLSHERPYRVSGVGSTGYRGHYGSSGGDLLAIRWCRTPTIVPDAALRQRHDAAAMHWKHRPEELGREDVPHAPRRRVALSPNAPLLKPSYSQGRRV